MSKVAILVTGSRDWDLSERKIIHDAIDSAIGDDSTHVVLLHGNCRGADTIAANYARKRGFAILSKDARWNDFGDAAGPMRNRQLLSLLSDFRKADYICHVLGFPKAKSKGTIDCIEAAVFDGFDTKITRG